MKTILKLNKSLLICITAFFLTLTACDEGGGGKSNVSGYVKHHSQLIPNAVVYIAYGVKEFPGTNVGNYDASVTAGPDAHYAFKDLHSGDYYLYSVGFDNTISQIVTGGIAVKLKYNKTAITDIPVTE